MERWLPGTATTLRLRATIAREARSECNSDWSGSDGSVVAAFVDDGADDLVEVEAG